MVADKVYFTDFTCIKEHTKQITYFVVCKRTCAQKQN